AQSQTPTGQPTAAQSQTPSGGGQTSAAQTWALQVTPSTDIAASGPQGGPFSPSRFTYTLSSSGRFIGYSITNVPNWLTASSTSGRVRSSRTITFSINSTANTLVPGSYVGNINFNNTTNGQGNASRMATLTVASAAQYTVAVSGSPSAGGTV